MNADRKKAWGRKIEKLMLAKGMRQSDLARACGLVRNPISTWINGRSYPSPLNLQKLARALGVTVADIAMKGEEGKPLGEGRKDQLDRIEHMLVEIYVHLGIGVFG